MSTETESVPPSAPGRPPQAPRRHGWLPIGAFLVVVVAGVVWWSRSPSPKSPGAEESASGASDDGQERIRVEVVHPETGGLKRTSTQIGSVHSFEYATLYAKVSGYLKWQQVDIGSRVKKGDVLAEIDDPEVLKEADRASAALTQAKAAVGQAAARVETAQADVHANEALISKAQADVASFTSKRQYREKELARYRDLLARQAVPQQIVDEYQDHFQSAQADEQAAEAAVVAAKSQMEAAKARVDQCKADLAEAKANVEVTTETLAKSRVFVDYTKILSPYTGVVTLRTYHVGDFVRSAADSAGPPLLSVARTDKMRVVTYIPDRDVPYTDLGDDAIVTLDALPGTPFPGKVSRFSYTEEVQSRTMRTEIDLENTKGLLREGMYGVATVILESNTSSLTVPTLCLTGRVEAGKSSVFVVKDGTAREVPVTLGTDNGIRVEVLKGLSREDQVITTKGAVADGAPVTVAPAPPSSAAGL